MPRVSAMLHRGAIFGGQSLRETSHGHLAGGEVSTRRVRRTSAMHGGNGRAPFYGRCKPVACGALGKEVYASNDLVPHFRGSSSSNVRGRALAARGQWRLRAYRGWSDRCVSWAGGGRPHENLLRSIPADAPAQMGDVTAPQVFVVQSLPVPLHVSDGPVDRALAGRVAASAPQTGRWSAVQLAPAWRQQRRDRAARWSDGRLRGNGSGGASARQARGRLDGWPPARAANPRDDVAGDTGALPGRHRRARSRSPLAAAALIILRRAPCSSLYIDSWLVPLRLRAASTSSSGSAARA